MASRARPKWIRIDADMFDNPKVLALTEGGHHVAVCLWLQSIAYSARHLSDGLVPTQMPRQWGYTKRHIDTLVKHRMWHPVEEGISEMLGGPPRSGWLINDFLAYQVSKEHWESVAVKRGAAARAMWDGRRT